MKKSEIILLFLFLCLFIGIRTVNFTEYLNFSFDQAWSSTRVLEIWRNKEITLVGPGSSIVVNGKQILQGSINYYFNLIFLLLGNFDPIISSYLFMLFAGLMIIPLYLGVRYLFNKNVAFFIVIIYSLLPLYIDFTRFFFGPSFQLSLLPLIVLFMGLYKKSKKLSYFFLFFFFTGIESQFHFAFLLIFIILFFYYLITYTTSHSHESGNLYNRFLLPILAFLIGFSPIIIFELKNNFYNIRLFAKYLQHQPSFSNFQLLPHRYLSISLIILILLTPAYKKYLSRSLLVLLTVLLIIIDLVLYLPKPKQAFGMAKNWNYLLEKKAYEIIKKENLKDFNIANLIYDNLSVVIKYQMKKDNYLINFDDYYHNKYLFVIDKSKSNISKNPAYEIQTFSPRRKLKQWKINNFYNLYLFERIDDRAKREKCHIEQTNYKSNKRQ